MRSSVLAATGLLAGVVLSLIACSDDETTGTGGSGPTGTSTSTSASTGAGAGSSASTGGGGEGAVGGSGGSGGSGGAGGSGGIGGAGGTGGAAMQSGDCDSDADCPGQKCAEVTPGGFRTCTTTPTPSNGCLVCAPNETCYPEFGYCGGIVGPMDKCYSDECQTDADCAATTICVAKGVLGRPVNLCMPASCKLDTDCTEVPGGICAPMDSPCCGIVEGLYCVYPGTGCRHQSDCPGGYCTSDGTKTMCMPGSAPCPVG